MHFLVSVIREASEPTEKADPEIHRAGLTRPPCLEHHVPQMLVTNGRIEGSALIGRWAVAAPGGGEP
jgi:hypothetical protein